MGFIELVVFFVTAIVAFFVGLMVLAGIVGLVVGIGQVIVEGVYNFCESVRTIPRRTKASFKRVWASDWVNTEKGNES
jgi:hypothetical protein